MSDKNVYKSFENKMDKLGRKFELSRIFNDLLTMSICAYHQTNIASGLGQKDAENEELYMRTIKPYSKDELNRFAKLLSCIQVSAFEDPYSDLLGRYFTEHITRGQNGQYFTPHPITQLLTKLTTPSREAVRGQKVYDPSCGSSRMLLDFAKANPDNYFFGNDISITCAQMSAVNLFLNGLRGEIACMNTLSMEWIKGWQINIPSLGIKPIDKEDSQIWAKAPEQAVKGKQLTLF